jgi:hypothetical protein
MTRTILAFAVALAARTIHAADLPSETPIGKSAYDHFPESIRPQMVKDWQKRREDIRRIIGKFDKAIRGYGLQQTPDTLRYNRAKLTYWQAELAKLEVNDPPFLVDRLQGTPDNWKSGNYGRFTHEFKVLRVISPTQVLLGVPDPVKVRSGTTVITTESTGMAQTTGAGSVQGTNDESRSNSHIQFQSGAKSEAGAKSESRAYTEREISLGNWKTEVVMTMDTSQLIQGKAVSFKGVMWVAGTARCSSGDALDVRLLKADGKPD